MRQLLVLLVGLCVLTACATDPGKPSAPEAGTTSGTPTQLADFGSYGPYRVGMTADEVRVAAQGKLTEQKLGGIGDCRFFTDPASTASPEDRVGLMLPRSAGYHLVGIELPIYARTTRGIGYGSEVAEVRSAYAGQPIEETESQAGTELLVKGDGPDNYFGFSVRDQHIVAVRTGIHDFAANYELCSG